MRTLVKQHAAAFACPCCAPVTAVVVTLRAVPVGNYPVYALDGTDFAACNHFTHLAVHAVGALVKHHCKQRLAFGCNRHHFLYLFGVHSGRLFANDVKSAFQRADTQLRVLVMGHGDDYGVNVRFVDEVCALAVAIERSLRILVAYALHFVGFAVGNRHNLGIGNVALLEETCDVSATHVAKSDNSVFYRFHNVLLIETIFNFCCVVTLQIRLPFRCSRRLQECLSSH